MAARSFRSLTLSQAGFYAFVAPLAGLAGLSNAAVAAPGYFWADNFQSPDAEIYREAPRVVRRARPSVLPPGADKAEKLAAQGKKPQGPLTIAISIQRQQVKVYDSNGLFAESPISSGMPGHSTPMGVFSIIQKSKFHRSNIYSGAPMPYMQRITWSGVAMHAGVLPGYPASHGCIRMPMTFAMKMWGWTRMGARVVVTPGEVSPVDFAHPALAALVPPAPVAEAPASANIRTADASGSVAVTTQRIMDDLATGSVGTKAEATTDAASVASGVAAEARYEPETNLVSDNDGLPSIPSQVAVDFSDLGMVSDDALGSTAAAEPQAPTQVVAENPLATESAVAAAADVAPPVIAPVEASEAAQSAPAKDQAQIQQSTTEQAPVVAAPLIKRNLPVAIFVSRKDARLYVRQNFTPLFDMPIEVASGDKALGTHVFTARAGGDEDKSLRWSVVSMPTVVRQASVASDDRGTQRRRAAAVPVAQVTSSTPDEALARLTLPVDLMARLGEALPAGSSLVVSDQGIAQGETGAGTDFIVRLR